MFPYCSAKMRVICLAIDWRSCRQKRTVVMRLPFLRPAAFLLLTALASSAAVPQHPRLLKRHGAVYGVRGIALFANCEGAHDLCHPYHTSGTILWVTHEPASSRIDGFMLATADGGRKFQNIDPAHLPLAAARLIRRGRRVRVSGTMAGVMQAAAPYEIVDENR